ncbi:MAG: hypothetical protein AB7O97_20330 [Planctomycetota bacterium]
MSAPARPRSHTALAAALALAAAGAGAEATAQDDLRDVVHLRNGKEVRGRLAQPFQAGEVLVVQGGKRVRLKAEDVERTVTVAAAVREFCERRLAMRQSPRAQWFLVEWARARGLEHLARLQATWLVLQTGDERAHEFLGHKKKDDRWLWRHEDRWYDLDQLRTVLVREPMLLQGERFAVRCEGHLDANVDALFDLERLGVWWMDSYGHDLLLDEVLAPIEVRVARDATEFPKWGFRPVPFYTPAPHGDVVQTFYAGPDPVRPRLLFAAAMQGLLYHTMIGSVDPRDERDRVCPWLEIGVGMLAEETLQGDPGFAAPGPPRAQDLQALQALGRDYRLTHLLHLPMYGGFYLMDDTPTAINWSAAAMFVQFLLQSDNIPDTRAPFLAYVRAALRERQGDSSSLFDATMGRRVEDLEQPFRKWLEKQAGY